MEYIPARRKADFAWTGAVIVCHTNRRPWQLREILPDVFASGKSGPIRSRKVCAERTACGNTLHPLSPVHVLIEKE